MWVHKHDIPKGDWLLLFGRRHGGGGLGSRRPGRDRAQDESQCCGVFLCVFSVCVVSLPSNRPRRTTVYRSFFSCCLPPSLRWSHVSQGFHRENPIVVYPAERKSQLGGGGGRYFFIPISSETTCFIFWRLVLSFTGVILGKVV